MKRDQGVPKPKLGDACNSPPVFIYHHVILFSLLYPKLGMMLGEIISCGDKMVASEFELLLI